MVNSLKIIVYLSKMSEGKLHDKRLAEALATQLDKPITLGMDLGFLGLKLSENIVQEMPVKKRKNKELTEEEKQGNREKSSRRVIVEHCMGGIKIMRMVKDVIRLHGDRIKEKVFGLAVAAHNLRIINKLNLCS